MQIRSYNETQDLIAEELINKNKKFYRCPKCTTVYQGASGLVNCGSCDYVKEGYKKEGGTIIKLK